MSRRAFFLASAGGGSLAPGYSARYQNTESPAFVAVPGLYTADCLTVYGVATRLVADGLNMLFSLPTRYDESVKNDLVYAGHNYGGGNQIGLSLNTYTSAFTGAGILSDYDEGKLFQYTARFYNAQPNRFRLRVNGRELALYTVNPSHAARPFGDRIYLGGDNNGGGLDWYGHLQEIVPYLSETSAAIDFQNESYLKALYNIV